MTTLSVVDLGVVDLHAAGLGVDEHVHAVGLGRGPHRVEVARVVRHRRRWPAAGWRGTRPAATRSISATASSMSVIGHRRGRRQPVEVRREPLDDVVVVDAGVRHRQLVVVGVEPEQRQVRVHHLHVDAVEVHVLEDELGVALGRAPAGLAVAGDRPALVARACAAAGRSGRRPRRAARSRSPPPRRRGRAGASGRRVRNRSVGSRRCPSAETTKSLSGHACDLPMSVNAFSVCANPVASVARPVSTVQRVTKRWKQRPDGSTWGDWGDDDELGRINLLTPEKVLAGRARGRGRHQLLPEPAARLPGRHRAEPAAAPAGARADRGHGGQRRPPSTTST